MTPDEKQRLFVNAESVSRALTICGKRGADYTAAEIALLCAVPLARSPDATGRKGLDVDFEEARKALCQPWPDAQLPAGQPRNSLEHWLKVFMRHPDAALEIMAMARADDQKHSEDVAVRALRELPPTAPLQAVIIKARALDPSARPDDETVKKKRQRLLKQNILSGLHTKKEKAQGDKKGQK